MRQVAVHHLKTIVQRPQGASEDVTDALETTTRCRVCLKHNEGLVDLLSDFRRVQ